ncbi:hypothetical protein PRUPE_6G138500 [Prunus persica]|uniref:Uncharacterized protein n=1 Tax=Prunus persica TaxID=3760 RepID=A0A251NQ92_PRUPE|nr:hypothetical protein PRUPE_6G138500 [Prunus persica]
MVYLHGPPATRLLPFGERFFKVKKRLYGPPSNTTQKIREIFLFFVFFCQINLCSLLPMTLLMKYSFLKKKEKGKAI